MQVFSDDGARVDVRVDGSGGSPIVLLAGFPLSRDIWNAQAEALSATHRVIRPDLRGLGASGVSDGPYLMESLAADIVTALDALGIERATIAGHSLGGYVALAFARMYTERVAQLVLVASRLAGDTPEQAKTRNALADTTERDGSTNAISDSYLPRLFAPETQRARPELIENVRDMIALTDPRGAAAMLRGMALRSPSDDIAPDLDVPVIVVSGVADAIIPLEEARTVASAFPRSRLVEFERSGHMPMLEEPGRMTEILEAAAIAV
jgi:pimeloyl-ACP methyl ester carboxylesterase